MNRYTFRMGWILFFALLGALAFWFVKWRQRHEEVRRAAEERASVFMAQAMAGAAPDPTARTQKLLLEAAAKAGEAGEPALAIQLYARFLSRYPDSALAPQARAAVEAQKKSLAKA
jgi:hypothetical protein